MKVYHKVTQIYSLSNPPKKAFNPTNKVAVAIVNSSTIEIETSLLVSKSNTAYALTEFELEGSSESESTSYKSYESDMNLVVKPVVKKTNLFEEIMTAFETKSSQDNPFAYFTGKAMERSWVIMDNGPHSPPNLVTGIIPSTVSSEDPKVRYVVGDNSEEIMRVRESASDNDFENAMYKKIFEEQQERQQHPQQQQYVSATRTE
jgi:hypothetical protein